MLARQIVIGFGLAFLFPLLVYYGVDSVAPGPKRADFFPTQPSLAGSATPEERAARAEEQRKREAAFAVAAKDFARVLVLVATPLGIAAVLVGTCLSVHSIGAGLILGGILAIGTGYWSYWDHLDRWLRFLSLLLGFAVLLAVGSRQGFLGPLRATRSS